MNWMPDISKANLRYLVAWWVLLLLILLFTQWRSRRACGLPLAYAMNLSLIHFFGALSHCFEYYTPRSAILQHVGVSLRSTYFGFWVSLCGLGAFTLGSIVAPMLLPARPRRLLAYPWPQVTYKLPGTLLLMASMFFLFGPVLRKIPSFASIAYAGTNLSVLAITLFCFQAYREGHLARFIKWFSSTAGFPFVTLITMGFAGFGIIAALNSWQLILRFFRPRWLGLLLLLIMCYGGITFYVNYMRERDSIRESVWGNRDYSSRLDRLWGLFSNFEFFSPYQQVHLETIDLRLNQNDLIGKSVEYIQSGRTSFAEGGTLVAAVVAVIPRIIWPDKPATGGSGSLVSRYTGMKFAEGTSVGIGHVMEFYINWGMPCVITGFFLFGLLLRYFDMKGAFYLNEGDFWSFARWALIGLSMLQPGGVLAEVAGTMAASMVLVQALHYQFFSQYYDHSLNLTALAAKGHGSKHS